GGVDSAHGLPRSDERRRGLRADGAVRHSRCAERFPLPFHVRMVTAMKLEFDRAAIERVVAAIADELDGEWLLIGGALVALWIEPRRVTEDIDVVGNSPDARQRLMELMD